MHLGDHVSFNVKQSWKMSQKIFLRLVGEWGPKPRSTHLQELFTMPVDVFLTFYPTILTFNNLEKEAF